MILSIGDEAVIHIVFILAVLLNGATDAANSVTGAVYSGALSYRRAAMISALLNFAGLVAFAAVCPGLYERVSSLSSGDVREAVATLATVVIFAGGAWLFSVPTSESHAMIAAMAGSGLAMGRETKVSTFVFIVAGALLSALLSAFFAGIMRIALPRRLLGSKAASVVGCCLGSFLHGAQDGQKFLALAVATGVLRESIGSVFAVALLMFAGTLFGGGRIVRMLGEKMTAVSGAEAVASDIGSAAGLLAVTLMGVPASTTHTKTCAIAGAAAVSGKRVGKSELAAILAGWILTLPVCFLLAYFITKTINLL